MDARKKISLVAPFYNEERNVQPFLQQVQAALAPALETYDLEIICVNDGSRDGTLQALKAARQQHPYVKVIDFSRNFGKEAAITAGLDFATGDAVIPIDSDLQHPPELILEMLTQWESGFEVVLARRTSRETDQALQRLTAGAFYEVSRYISH